MTTFVDSSAWYAAADDSDDYADRARDLLVAETRRITTDYVVAETWRLLRVNLGYERAETFLAQMLEATGMVERVTRVDLDRTVEIGRAFADQRFSLVDRTSFATMERLGIDRAISFDKDFLVYRYGQGRRQAFEVLR